MADDECLDPPMSRMVMQKTWCHGQLIAAAQGLAYGCWGLRDSALARPARAVLIACALVLPAWSVTSWRMMNGRSASSAQVILAFGLLLIPLYVAVLLVCVAGLRTSHASGDEGSPWLMVALIATALQLVETAAYLVVVACLRKALGADAVERHELM